MLTTSETIVLVLSSIFCGQIPYEISTSVKNAFNGFEIACVWKEKGFVVGVKSVGEKFCYKILCNSQISVIFDRNYEKINYDNIVEIILPRDNVVKFNVKTLVSSSDDLEKIVTSYLAADHYFCGLVADNKLRVNVDKDYTNKTFTFNGPTNYIQSLQKLIPELYPELSNDFNMGYNLMSICTTLDYFDAFLLDKMAVYFEGYNIQLVKKNGVPIFVLGLADIQGFRQVRKIYCDGRISHIFKHNALNPTDLENMMKDHANDDPTCVFVMYNFMSTMNTRTTDMNLFHNYLLAEHMLGKVRPGTTSESESTPHVYASDSRRDMHINYAQPEKDSIWIPELEIHRLSKR